VSDNGNGIKSKKAGFLQRHATLGETRKEFHNKSLIISSPNPPFGLSDVFKKSKLNFGA